MRSRDSSSNLLIGLLTSIVAFACGGGDSDTSLQDQVSMDAGSLAMDAAVDYTCPPAPPFGVKKGQSVRNVILEDCDGNTYQIHGLCGHRAAWFFVYAGW
ncbi:MAG: hypothetical protein VYC39_08205 [Myxococcota bacterium]|nr:hypothetical protein [Myxococcota bacterium]